MALNDSRALVKSKSKTAVLKRSASDRLGTYSTVSAAVALGGSGIGALVLWLAGLASASGAVAFVGLVANVVMGGAALGAFGLWRKQLHAQTEHSTVREVLAVALRRTAVLTAIDDLDSVWRLCELKIVQQRVLDETEALARTSLREYLNDLEAVREKVHVDFGKNTAVLDRYIELVRDVRYVTGMVSRSESFSPPDWWGDIQRQTYGAMRGDRSALGKVGAALEAEVSEIEKWAELATGTSRN